MMNLWQQYQVWRARRRIIRELREAARLHVLTHDYAIAGRIYDRIDEIKKMKPLPLAKTRRT